MGRGRRHVVSNTDDRLPSKKTDQRKSSVQSDKHDKCKPGRKDLSTMIGTLTVVQSQSPGRLVTTFRKAGRVSDTTAQNRIRLSLQKSSLKAKRNLLAPGTRYTCRICNYGFCFYSGLLSHYRKQHGSFVTPRTRSSFYRLLRRGMFALKLKGRPVTVFATTPKEEKENDEEVAVKQEVCNMKRLRLRSSPDPAWTMPKKTIHRWRGRKRKMTARVITEGTWKCGWCAVTFPGRSELQEHRREVHRKKVQKERADSVKSEPDQWECEVRECGAVFDHRSHLNKHMVGAHPLLRCPNCSFKTRKDRSFQRYKIIYGLALYFIVAFAGMSFLILDSCFQHWRCDGSDLDFFCAQTQGDMSPKQPHMHAVQSRLSPRCQASYSHVHQP